VALRHPSKSRRALAPEMSAYLWRAAQHPWDGILIGKSDRKIAKKAIAAGYGAATDGWFPLFVINDHGRLAIGLPGKL
jgi:hypothetical protein